MKTTHHALMRLLLLTAVYSLAVGAQSITWQNTNLPYTSVIMSFAFPQPGVVFVGTYSGIIFRSTNNGGNWTPVDTLTSNVRLATNKNGEIFASNTYYGVFRSTDNGVTWLAVNAGLPNTNGTAGCIVINQTNGHIFVRVFDGVYRSTDNGNSWVVANSGLPKDWCTGFAITSTGDILAATHGAGIFRSTNDGSIWAAADSGLTDAYVEWLAINPVNGHVFAGTAFSAPFRSTNNGDYWTMLNTGSPTVSLTTLAANSRGDVCGGAPNDAGIYRSINDGDSWEHTITGLTSLSVTALGASPDGYMYAGTQNGCVFRTTEPTTNVENKSIPQRAFALTQNYPNPFNPTTNISFSIPSKVYTTLRVFDVIGQEVATLISEELSAGSYTRQWNAAHIPSGVYFYKLQAGTYTETKKLLLLK